MLMDDLLGQKYIIQLNLRLSLEAIILKGPANTFLSMKQPDHYELVSMKQSFLSLSLTPCGTLS